MSPPPSMPTPPPSMPTPPPAPSCGALHAGETLTAGQSLHSCNGRYRLAMQVDGNLVIYDGRSPIWATHTQLTSGHRAVLQGDGNFVLYTPTNRALWASYTVGRGGVRVAMQNDGNLVIYTATNAPVWASHTAGR
jgi:hypothetical protein